MLANREADIRVETEPLDENHSTYAMYDRLSFNKESV